MAIATPDVPDAPRRGARRRSDARGPEARRLRPTVPATLTRSKRTKNRTGLPRARRHIAAWNRPMSTKGLVVSPHANPHRNLGSVSLACGILSIDCERATCGVHGRAHDAPMTRPARTTIRAGLELCEYEQPIGRYVSSPIDAVLILRFRVLLWRIGPSRYVLRQASHSRVPPARWRPTRSVPQPPWASECPRRQTR